MQPGEIGELAVMVRYLRSLWIQISAWVICGLGVIEMGAGEHEYDIIRQRVPHPVVGS